MAEAVLVQMHTSMLRLPDYALLHRVLCRRSPLLQRRHLLRLLEVTINRVLFVVLVSKL
jgi:hypothetical protein